MDNNPKKAGMKDVEVGLVVASVVILGIFLVFMMLNSQSTVSGITTFFWWMIEALGPLFQLFTLATFILAIYLCVGKYGKIRLGEGKPEFSTLSYITMMILASLASATIYWAFAEWAFYYYTPGLGIESMSLEALEMALPYQFYHWGIVNQAMYTVMGVAIAYAVYVRKVKSFQTSAVCSAMMGEKVKGKSAIGKVIDFVVIFGILGALSSSLGLGVPLAATAISKITGIEVTAALQLGVIVVVGILYTITSIVGIHKGMKFVSNLATALTGLFFLYILLTGPASFILKNIVNSLGLTVHNMLKMTLFTDPITQSGFTEGWTIYFQAFYLNYLAMMGIFVAKVSKGRTIREIALATLLGITSGSVIIFGVLGSLSIDTFIQGLVDVPALVNGLNGNAPIGEGIVFEVINTLPLGEVIGPIVILLLIVSFLVPSLDSASMALAETSTKAGTPPLKLRIFFCVLLAVIPMSVIISGSGFDAIKYLAIILSVPFVVVVIFVEIGLLKWLKQDDRNGVHAANLALQEQERQAQEQEVAK